MRVFPNGVEGTRLSPKSPAIFGGLLRHGTGGGDIQATPGRAAFVMARMQRNGQDPSELRVLVVEDDPDTAESLRALLLLCGYQVMVAHTSQQGIETARKLEPHIVLCDIGLPDADGYVVGSILRQSGHSTALLIAVTGYAGPQHRLRALAAGFDQHLVKPVDPKVLLRELQTQH